MNTPDIPVHQVHTMRSDDIIYKEYWERAFLALVPTLIREELHWEEKASDLACKAADVMMEKLHPRSWGNIRLKDLVANLSAPKNALKQLSRNLLEGFE